MRWKILPGYELFDSIDEEIEFRAGNRTIRPRIGGDIVTLPENKLHALVRQGQLNRMVPADDEAKAWTDRFAPATQMRFRSSAS